MLFRCSPEYSYIEFDPPWSSIHSDNFAFDWNVYQPMRSKEWTKEINGTWGTSSLLSESWTSGALVMIRGCVNVSVNFFWTVDFLVIFCVNYSFWAFNLCVNYSSWAFNLWVNSFWAFASTCVWALNFCTFRSFGAPFIFDIFPCFIYVGAPVSLHFFMILQCGAPKIAKLVYNSNNYGLWYL